MLMPGSCRPDSVSSCFVCRGFVGVVRTNTARRARGAPRSRAAASSGQRSASGVPVARADTADFLLVRNVGNILRLLWLFRRGNFASVGIEVSDRVPSSAKIPSSGRGKSFSTRCSGSCVAASGRAGSGRQFVSWIHYEDFVAAVRWLIERRDIDGAVNLHAPRRPSSIRTCPCLRRPPTCLRAPAMRLHARDTHQPDAACVPGRPRHSQPPDDR